MKTNSFIGRTGLWAVGLCLLGWAALAVSCTGMGREELTQGENASLTVTLSGQVPVSKAVGSPDDAEAVKEAENKLHNVTVFVFNSNGTLDKKHTFRKPLPVWLRGPKRWSWWRMYRQRLHFRTASITVGLKMPVM